MNLEVKLAATKEVTLPALPAGQSVVEKSLTAIEVSLLKAVFSLTLWRMENDVKSLD
jgi:hypothetical protein